MNPHDVDTTITKIEQDLEENENDAPKGAPTQQGINASPYACPEIYFKARCLYCDYKIEPYRTEGLNWLPDIDAATEHANSHHHIVVYTFISQLDATSGQLTPMLPAWLFYVNRYSKIFKCLFGLSLGWALYTFFWFNPTNVLIFLLDLIICFFSGACIGLWVAKQLRRRSDTHNEVSEEGSE